MLFKTAGSDSDSEPGSPLRDSPTAPGTAATSAATSAAAPAAVSEAVPPAQQDNPGARHVEREDWMTKSFPKAAAQADDVPLPGAKPDDKKVCAFPNTRQHTVTARESVQRQYRALLLYALCRCCNTEHYSV